MNTHLLDNTSLDAAPAEGTVPGRIVQNPQSAGDRSKLEKVFPVDRKVTCVSYWELGKLYTDVVNAGVELPKPSSDTVRADRKLKLMAEEGPKLQSLSARLKVPWDATASKETVVERILDAEAKKAAG